jgi:hypothetical protein
LGNLSFFFALAVGVESKKRATECFLFRPHVYIRFTLGAKSDFLDLGNVPFWERKSWQATELIARSGRNIVPEAQEIAPK